MNFILTMTVAARVLRGPIKHEMEMKILHCKMGRIVTPTSAI